MSCEILVKIKNDSRARQRKRTLCRVREFKVERVFQEFRSPYSRAQSYTFSLEWPVLYYKNKLLVSLFDLGFHLANRCRTALVSILHLRVQTNNTDMAESTKSALLKIFISYAHGLRICIAFHCYFWSETETKSDEFYWCFTLEIRFVRLPSANVKTTPFVDRLWRNKIWRRSLKAQIALLLLLQGTYFHTIAKKTEDLKIFTTCLNSCEGRRFVCVVNCVTFQLVALVNSSDRPTVFLSS